MRKLIILIGCLFMILTLAACTQLTENPSPATQLPPTAVSPTIVPTIETPVIMCTPPACAANEVYFCGGDCPGGCGTTCATITPDSNDPTPFPLCTPPACAANEVYFCSGDCPGGCGTTCATVTPVAPVDVGTAPTTWPELADWLTAVWQQNTNPAIVRAALQTAGWQQNDGEWLAVDMTGDGRDEWALALHDPQNPTPPEVWYGFSGDFWVVSDWGVVYQHHADAGTSERDKLRLAPVILTSGDLTGDGRPELITQVTECGAHTCFGTMRILSAANGPVANVVRSASNTIAISVPEARLEDQNGDGRLDFLVHGGTIGSVGAGMMRAYTEVWRWDGTAVTLADTILDPTTYRHHYLYEANDKLAQGDLPGALFLYEETINNPALQTAPFNADEATTTAAIQQFAAFRLMSIDLLQGDRARAAGRLNWLNTNHPGTAVAFAADQLLNGWTGPGDQAALCAIIETSLASFPDPTGPLIDQGYGNPSLTAEDLCP